MYYYKNTNIWGIKVDGKEAIKIGGKYLDTEKSKEACAQGSVSKSST